MGKRPVCFGEGIAPYCPNCRSGEYLYNEDTEQIKRKYKCRDCIKYEYITSSHQICKAKGIRVAGCRLACKKHFKARIVKFP